MCNLYQPKDMAKSRITYIDTLKGVCIILVMLMHCGLPVGSDNEMISQFNDALRTYRMPTYYFLSGIFFKTYGGLGDFTRRKVNNIIIPLFFFYILNVVGSFLFVSCLNLLNGQSVSYDWVSVFDIFYRIDWRLQCVIPLWFLLSLFWANLIFYVIKSKFNDVVSCILIASLAIVGFFLDVHKVPIPWYITSSLIGLPYFVLGYYIKQIGWLQCGVIRWLGLLQFLIVGAIVVCIARDYTQVKTLSSFLLYRYLVPFASVLSLFWCCKSLPRAVPIVTFLGRYSLIVLGTHMFLISYLYLIPMRLFGADNKWLCRLCMFAIVILLELMIVPFMRDKFAKFTAQKEFFKPGWKIKAE